MRQSVPPLVTLAPTHGSSCINIQIISTSEIKIAVVIDEKYTELAVRVLHETFGLQG